MYRRESIRILLVEEPDDGLRGLERPNAPGQAPAGASSAASHNAGVASRSTKKLLFLAIATCFSLLLLACAGNVVEPIAQEGTLTRRITWVIAENPAEQCGRIGRPLLMYGKTLGCADWKNPGNCVIYVRAPKNADDRRGIETLGHEVLHCFAGRFHGMGPTE